MKSSLALVAVVFIIILTVSLQQPTSSNVDYGELLDTSASWRGVGDDWRFWDSIDVALTDWEAFLAGVAEWRFDTVRLAFCFASVGQHTRLAYDELDRVLDVLKQHGLKAILDCHNWQDMHGFFGSPEWLDGWKQVAERYKHDQRILAYELFNEPFKETWHESVTGEGADAILQTYYSCMDAIRASGDSHTIVVCPWAGIDDPLGSIPSPRSNVIATFHAWTFANSIEQATEEWEYAKGIIQAWMNRGWQVWMGECGVLFDWSYPRDVQTEYLQMVLDFCSTENMGFNLWLYPSRQPEYEGVFGA